MTSGNAVVQPPVDEAFAGYLAKLKITAATGSGSWKKGANDALGNVVTTWDAVVRPHILAQAAQIERLTEELRSIDLAFGNRTALDDCKTRADKINKMCDAAGKYFTERQLREAEKARTADLLKTLERVEAIELSVQKLPNGGDPAISLLHMLEAWQEIRAVLAAAKGETV